MPFEGGRSAVDGAHRQFGRLAADPSRILAATDAVGWAAVHLYEKIQRWSTDPTLPSSRGDADIGEDAFALGPGMLLPGFGRAVGGVGVAGGRILKRPDAQKLIREMHASGKTDSEIAWALNERFAPIIDEGTGITRAQAMHTRNRMTPDVDKSRSTWTPEMHRRLKALAEEFPQGSPKRSAKIAENFREHFPEYPGSDATIQTMVSRSKNWGGVNERTGATDTATVLEKGGDFELGVMGGRGSSSKITADDVAQIMREHGWERVNVKPADSPAGSAIVTGHPPGNPPRSQMRGHPGDDTPMVRVPEDDHMGRALRNKEPGNRIDLGSDPAMASGPRRDPIDERALMNAAGEPYTNPEALRGWVQWRSGELVSPDKAPRGVRELPPLKPRASAPTEGPIHDPRQLKLLSGGFPIPSPSREDAGRFSRPAWSPDEMAETRWMTTEVSRAADAIDEDFPSDRLSLISRSSPWRPIDQAWVH